MEQLVVQHVLPPTVFAVVVLSAALHVARFTYAQLAWAVVANVLKLVGHAVQDAVAPTAPGAGCVYVFAAHAFVVPAVAPAAHQ